MVIQDKIADCAPYLGRISHRSLRQIAHITIHRVDPIMMSDALGMPLSNDIVGVAKGDAHLKEVGGLAYTFCVLPDGTIQIGRPLSHCTPHALGRNASGCGVAMLGNFDLYKPAKAQWDAAVELVAHLCRELPLEPSKVEGHDEINGGSHDTNKRCPGSFWPMSSFRADVIQQLDTMALVGLESLGIVV